MKWFLGVAGSVIFLLIGLNACAPKLTYPPDQATLDACRHDCIEKRRICQGPACDADQTSCIQHCRDFGGIRGGGRGITLEVP